MAELRSLVAALLLLLVVADDTDVRSTDARQLRPSDHGLAYQASPPEGDEPSPEMLTFFGTSSSLPPPSSASAAHPPSVALPQALNSSDAALWSQLQDKPSLSSSSSSRSRSSSDRVMKYGLMIGSLVCGIAGVALLAASVVIFLFFTARKPTSPPPPPPSSASDAPPPQQRDHDNAIACIPPATA